MLFSKHNISNANGSLSPSIPFKTTTDHVIANCLSVNNLNDNNLNVTKYKSKTCVLKEGITSPRFYCL